MQDKLTFEEKINAKSKTWWDRVTNFFNKIEFLELDDEKKAEVALKVKENSVPDRLFRIEIFLSWVIASLWLLQNSVAVVIWAMLIAPFLRPMNGIWFSIARGEKTFFWIPVKVLFFSIIISIITWFVSTKIIWLNVETPEILARTSPNIIDLFIAVFSAMVAVLSLWFTRLSESIAWVAIAAALMPPLAVVGIELAFWKYLLAWWAMMLFLANVISIILVATIFFWLYWFTPKTWLKQRSVAKRFWFLITVILIVSIPLIGSLFSIKQKINIQHNSIVYLQNIIKQKTLNFSIDKLEVKKITSKKIEIFAEIKIPEGLNFYDTFKKQLDLELSKKFWKDVDLEIELIRTANITSSENENSTEAKIYDFISYNLEKFKDDYHILSLEINNSWKYYKIKAILWVSDDYFNDSYLSLIAKKTREKFPDLEMRFSWIPLQEYNKNSQNKLSVLEEFKLNTIKDINSFISSQVLEWISVKNTKIDISVFNDSKNYFTNFDIKKIDLSIDLEVDIGKKDNLSIFLWKIKKINSKYNNINLNVKYSVFKEINLIKEKKWNLVK